MTASAGVLGTVGAVRRLRMPMSVCTRCTRPTCGICFAPSPSAMPEPSAGPLAAYLRKIDRYPLLTPEQESRLAQRWKRSRDPDAARLLALSNLRFVVKVAFEYRTYGVRILDLIQEGNLGLLVAVDRFDAGRGNRLTTYAVWWIRAYIQDFIRRQWSLVRFGTTRAEQRCFYRLRREREKLERHGGAADPKRLAEALGVRED